MKRYLLYPFISIFMLGFLLIVSAFLLVFFRPLVVANPQNLALLLKRTDALEAWSWKKAVIEHEWIKWNERIFSGQFNKFCFLYQHPAAKIESCFDLSWNLRIGLNSEKGFYMFPEEPLILHSPVTKIALKEGKKKSKEKSPPPPISKYWSMLWSEVVPEARVKFDRIVFTPVDGEEREFDLELIKSENDLLLKTLGFTLTATPEMMTLVPPSPYLLPKELGTRKKLFFHDLKLTALMEKEGIPLKLTGNLEGWNLEAQSWITLPLKSDFSSIPFKKDVLSHFSATLLIRDINKAVATYVPGPYNELPAPFNVMDGEIHLQAKGQALEGNQVLLNTKTRLDLRSTKQVLDMEIAAGVPLDVSDFSRGLIEIGIDFNKVTLQLPRISRKSAPPQFFPDSRFVSSGQKKKDEKKQAKKSNLELDLEALNEKALHLRTNLLDGPLRLNFNLHVRQGELKNGFVQVLPLKTKIFKRPVKLDHLRVKFNAPKPPVLNATIKFPLPEYKITLKLEGPVSDPTYALSSDPPLPEDDILAVLLFGRPMDDLEAEDKTAASRTGQLLSQGILSLSVLYFLAGSPVEYIGYDPGSKKAFAQIGLDRKSSLRVGRGNAGQKSTSIRRSLGNGWYLDTSVQDSVNERESGANYGVLLERVIAY